MISAWFKHLKTPEEQEKFKGAVLGSKVIFRRMSEILDEKEAELSITENDYDTLNWAYRQADANGYRRCLKEIQKLINLGNK